MPIGRLINRADTHAAWLSHHHFRVQRDEGTGSTSVPSLNLSAEDVRLTFRPWYRKNDFTPPNNTLSRLIPKALYRPALKALGITPLLTATTGTGDGVARGRLGPEQMTQLLDGLDPARTDVLICGPGPLMTSLTDTLAGLGVPLSRIDYERFSYGAGTLSAKDKRRLGAVGG